MSWRQLKTAAPGMLLHLHRHAQALLTNAMHMYTEAWLYALGTLSVRSESNCRCCWWGRVLLGHSNNIAASYTPESCQHKCSSS